MMYQKSGNYVACAKVDGKILREDADGVVNLPFGAEFSILLKNLNSVRAVAKVTVDGVEASGHGIIIPANGSVDLERFLKRDGDMSRGNKFKFIERTAGIEEHKGIGAEDGLIRVEYLTEIQPPIHQTTVIEHVQHVYNRYPYYSWPYYYPYGYPTLGGGVIYGGLSQSVSTSNSLGSQMNANMASQSQDQPFIYNRVQGGAKAPGQSVIRSAGMRESQVERSAAVNSVGITVPGAESNQKFTTGEWFKTETASHVIVLQLRGVVGGKPVVAAITVKTKKKCSTCGTASKSNVQFCGKCGTSLNIL